MVTISKALNSGQVQDYHKSEFGNAQENYYTQADEIKGRWRGQLAAEWGLNGPVSSEHFTQLSDGQNPNTGAQLIRHRHASTYVNEHGETVDSTAHRAGWDATFSAPKSVSITALVGGDDRVRDAHRAAVSKALDYLERHVEARIGGNRPTEHSGKWAVATFEHDSARPVDGFAAPQLHTHSVFFNVTKTEDGTAHAIDPRSIFKAQSMATAIYQSELAYNLRQLGYELETGKNGAPEIKGYTQEYLQANSPRSAQIQDRLQELEQQGILSPDRTSDAEARQIAAHATRASKAHYSHEQMRSLNASLARDFGNQHKSVIASARRHAHERGHDTGVNTLSAASEAVTYARDKTFEQEAVVSERELLRNALRRGQGVTTFDHIESAFKQRQEDGAFLLMKGKNNERAYTTPEMLRLERDTIELMKHGRAQHRPLAADNTLDQESLAKLNANQKKAALEMLASTDTVQALQGAAGTGKTYTLKVVREHLERNGYEVRGLAPTSRAAQQLAECGAECSTLQKHQASKPEHVIERAGKSYRVDIVTSTENGKVHAAQHLTERRPKVYLLDETSLASTKQVNDLLHRLHADDRVILIGDVRQHEAVEAGRAFAQLQEHGVHTAKLDQIVRQKDPSLKEAVELLAENRIPESVSKLREQGRITEIANEHERFKVLAAEYLKAPDSTLVVSPDNRSRAAINGLVHDQLRETGKLAGNDHNITVYVTRQDMSGADRKWAAKYEVRNVLRFTNGGSQFQRGEYVRVTGVDSTQNLVTVAKQDGTEVTYDPRRRSGVNVYRVDERKFAVGERIQFTTPYTEQKVANRDLGRITEIGKNGALTVALDSGRSIFFHPKEYAHLDHGYAVTSHSSQGLTTDRVLVNLDPSTTNASLINNRLAYVAISRGRFDAHIYTNDATQVEHHLSRDVSKSSAIAPPEHAQEHANSEQKHQHGHTQQTAAEHHHMSSSQQHTPSAQERTPNRIGNQDHSFDPASNPSYSAHLADAQVQLRHAERQLAKAYQHAPTASTHAQHFSTLQRELATAGHSRDREVTAQSLDQAQQTIGRLQTALQHDAAHASVSRTTANEIHHTLESARQSLGQAHHELQHGHTLTQTIQHELSRGGLELS